MAAERDVETRFVKLPSEVCSLNGGIHVWRFFSDPAGESLLSKREAAVAEKFQSASARAAFVAGRSGLRRAASLYTNVPPADLRIVPGGNGKPFFENAGIHFNLSHSGSAVVAAFADFPVGMDIESRGRCRDFVGIARRFFHPEEADKIAGSGDEGQFLRFWTGKEAMLKLSGEGISGGLHEARPGDGGTGALRGGAIHLTAFSFEKFVGTVASFRDSEVKGWFQF